MYKVKLTSPKKISEALENKRIGVIAKLNAQPMRSKPAIIKVEPITKGVK